MAHEVPEKLQLSYYVGEAVINDSYAEHEARVFWNILHDVGLVEGNRPEMFGRLLPALEAALAVDTVPGGFRSIALPLLDRTREWHRYRRDLVHDLLSTGWGKPGEVHSALGKNPVRSIAQLAQCGAELQRASYGLRGLWIIGPYWLGGQGDSWETPESLRSWTRVAMGHIADVPNEIRGIPGPAPEPERGWDLIIRDLVNERELRERAEESMFIDLDD